MLPQLPNLLAELAKNQWPSILSLHFLMTSIFLVLLANFLPFLSIGHLESLLLQAVAFFPLLLAVTSSFTVAGDCSCASDPLACFSISSSIFHPAHSASSISICSLTTLLSSIVSLQLSAIFLSYSNKWHPSIGCITFPLSSCTFC